VISYNTLLEKAIQIKISNWKKYVLEVNPEFSFNDKMFESKNIDYWMKRLFSKLGWKSRHPFLKALARGFGLHDNNLPKPYR
jgi:hypothetical protein